MLVVGDSRVKGMKDIAQNLDCEGWRIEFIVAPGAKLDKTIEPLEKWKMNQFPDQPKMVVLVTIFHDLVVKRRRPDGSTFLQIADSIFNGNSYPALAGLVKRVNEVEKKLKGWWQELNIYWLNPFPVDVRRWTEAQACNKTPLSKDDIDSCHQVTYKLSWYAERANIIGSRVNGWGDRFIPWFCLWNDAMRADTNYNDFYEKYEFGMKFGWINRTRTSDGMIPSPALAKQSMKMLFRKAWVISPPPRSLAVLPTRPHPRKQHKESMSTKECKDLVKRSEVDALMLQINEVQNLVAKMDLDIVKPGEGLGGSTRAIHGFGPASARSDYGKVRYPCGHCFPFVQIDERLFSPEKHCPVCDMDYSDKTIVTRSFHLFEFE